MDKKKVSKPNTQTELAHIHTCQVIAHFTICKEMLNDFPNTVYYSIILSLYCVYVLVFVFILAVFNFAGESAWSSSYGNHPSYRQRHLRPHLLHGREPGVSHQGDVITLMTPTVTSVQSCQRIKASFLFSLYSLILFQLVYLCCFISLSLS